MPKLRTKRLYHRNGQIHSEIRMSGRAIHGLRRTWHQNGRLATADPYRHGLLHGVCRQWNDTGQFLGSYLMRNGTGVQYAWYEDGGLHMEFSTVEGKWTGRSRSWLRDGTLASEEWLIENREVTRAEYHKRSANHPCWPKYPDGEPHQKSLSQRQFEARSYCLHCQWLLSKASNQEAQQWLEMGNSMTRSLGKLGYRQAKALVAALSAAGASQVLAVDVYQSKERKQFCDNLLVRLPKAKGQRLAIRRLFERLPRRAHCAIQPDKDSGQEWLYVYFG